ncbi:hamartin [Ophiocordyceps camponoti-floridani]|uniref:Hamartin n=1 Tax=Ophiocordyceps camponoti-floridani TaxID=2030778 RepID=A0A8H4VD48_9HYPO|nr:hamartin [Ophiocordyceps camponoti-floridani]
MASPAPSKNLSKAILACVVQPVLPLPESVVDAITGYVEHHDKHDDAASDRLQDELSAVFEKHVKGNLVASPPWIAVLRRLLPALPTSDRVLSWFDSCKSLLDTTGIDQMVVDETIAALVDLVAQVEQNQPASEVDLGTSRITDALLSISITRIYPALIQGNTSHEYNDKIVRRALKSFGKKKPKDFFTSVDAYFVKKQHRHASLRLLCDFIHDKPPHLHQVLHTTIFSNLLTCLQHDTSTTVVSSALTVVIMLLPHMPSSLVPHLPTLFNVYARLLFWDRERSSAAEASPEEAEKPSIRSWEVCSYEADMDDFSVPQLSNYYTILYGLYPINFMDYIRKPQRYLRHANTSNLDDIEVQPSEIRHRSERFRRCHLLHSNFYTMTIDSEKTDHGRWIKSEAAEVLVYCMGLYRAADVSESPDGDGMPGAAPNEGMEKDEAGAALSTSRGVRPHSWRDSQLTNTDSETSTRAASTVSRRASQSSSRVAADQGRATGHISSSPMMAAQMPRSPSQSQLQGLMHSNKVIKAGLHQSLANDSVTSLALSHQEVAVDKAPEKETSQTVVGAQVANLQRRVLMLENDLSFERYVKQQHMAHIGELRRRQMVEAASEAEAQNLIMLNRNLKSRFEEAKKAEKQIRKESEKSRALAKKWESDLANKVKMLRDESKRAATELGALRRELEESTGECDKLRKLVCEAEVKELNLQQKMQSLEIQRAEVDRLREQVEELTKSGHDEYRQQTEQQAALNASATAEAKVDEMRAKLAAQKHDAEHERDMMGEQVKALQEQLAESQEERARPGTNSNLAMESAFAASRAKQAELQKQYNLLTRKYTALQSSLLDMQSEASASASASASALASTTGPAPATREPGGPSSGEYQAVAGRETEASGYNRAARPVSYAGMPTSAELERRASAAEGPVSGERHFGGRLHSRSRKESRDKGGKEEGSGGKAKKEKKPSGLRGIRGFV